jgi:hypothetical protein
MCGKGFTRNRKNFQDVLVRTSIVYKQHVLGFARPFLSCIS